MYLYSLVYPNSCFCISKWGITTLKVALALDSVWETKFGQLSSASTLLPENQSELVCSGKLRPEKVQLFHTERDTDNYSGFSAPKSMWFVLISWIHVKFYPKHQALRNETFSSHTLVHYVNYHRCIHSILECTVLLNVGTSTVKRPAFVHTFIPRCASSLNYSSLDYLEYGCREFSSVLLVMYYACCPSAFAKQDNGIMFRSGTASFDIIEYFSQKVHKLWRRWQ